MLKKFEGEKRKHLLFLGGAVLLIGGIMFLLSEILGGEKKQVQNQPPPPKIETPPPTKMEDETLKAQYGMKIAELEKQIEELKKQQQQQMPPPQDALTQPLQQPQPQIQPQQPFQPPPPPPPPPPGQQYPPTPPPQEEKPSRPIDLIALEKVEVPKEEVKKEKEQEVVQEKPPVKKGAIIPAGAFVKGILLSGLDAPTGARAQTSPHPVLIRITDKAVLPNFYRSDIKECFVIGSGYGDLASERAYIRLESIACVKRSGEVVERQISGYVAGEDGKVGLLGRVVTKQGQVLARMLLAGFIEGIARVFQQSATTVIVSPQGTLQTVDPQQALRAGVAGGFTESARVLVEQYKKLAEETYPVIEINAGRRVDLVFLQSFSLEGTAGEQVIKPERGLNKPPPDPAAPIQ